MQTRVPGWVWVVALAGCTRLLLLLMARAAPFWSVPIVDELVYLQLAQTLLDGGAPPFGAFYTAPGYTYFLSGVLAVGGGPVSAKLLQLALGCANAVLLYFLGRRVFGPTTGFIAAALWALYPVALLHELLLLKPTLTVFFTLLALNAIAVGAEERPRPKLRWILAGLALGAAALFRGEVILVAAWIVIAAWVAHKRGWPGAPKPAHAALLGLGLALVVAIPTVQNARWGSGLVVLAYGGGTNFYIGNHADADGSYLPLLPDRSDAVHEEQDAVRIASGEERRELRPSEVSRFWWEQGLGFWRHAPLAAMGLTLKKWALLWGGHEIADVMSTQLAGEYVPLLRNPLLHAAVLLPLALVGLWWTRSCTWLWPLWAYMIASQLALVPFFLFERFRLPMTAVALLFSAEALRRMFLAVRSGSYRSALLAGGATVALALLLFIPRVSREEEVLRVNMGSLLMQSGRYEEALVQFQRVRAAEPSAWRVEMNIALAQAQLGRTQPALRSLYNVLERLYAEGKETGRPSLQELVQCHELAGDLQVSIGQSEFAQRQYDAALQFDPGNQRLRTKRDQLGP